MYGTERMALATLEGLTEYRRYVFAPRSDAAPALLNVARDLRYDVRPFKRPGDLAWALLPLFLRHREIDVISTSATHNVLCTWLARLCFVRLRQLNVVHGGGEDRYSYANKHRLNKTGTVLVAVSRFVRDRLVAHDVPERKIVVVENFLSDSDLVDRPSRPRFDPAMADARPIERAQVKVVVVSRLESVKRLDVLLAAIETGRLQKFRFDVFGTGELLDPLRQRVESRGAPVTFHGYVPDLPERLADADFLLHLCPTEPFGLAILEAFAAGLPPIVPAAGGAGELVDDGVTGMQYPAADADALASCLTRASELEGRHLDAMVSAGRAVLAGRFSAQAGAAAYRRALRQAA
ncbi:MAG TPA: glycosyltransferase family 4 protein [Burkholderiaceae bacterium]|nr:glycosyltransferase family 4 protein [Burkholderiaceae bacterium]